jgi:hypothetical protein
MPRYFLLIALLTPLAVAAQDLPKLKAGLWEMTNVSSRNPGQPMKSTVCLDTTLQQDMIRMGTGMMQGMCSKHDLKVSGNKVTGEAICNLGGSTMTSRSVMTMTGDTAYRTEAHARFDPPMMGSAQSDTVIEGRYLGACRPGQRPGDMTMPNGQTMNIRNMMSGPMTPPK